MRVAILIKTLRREACLFNTLDSIATFCDVPYRLYIADDGPASPEKLSRYEQLSQQGHFIMRFDGPTPVTAARNALARSIDDENVLLRIDDDFEFFEKTNLRAMQGVLDADPAIGVVADTEIQCGDGKGVRDGECSPNQGFLEIRDGTLYKAAIPVSDWLWNRTGAYRYAYADYTRNFLLIRRECILACPWDERIFMAREHTDFLMSIAAAGWKLAFTPDSAHKHRDDLARQCDDETYNAQSRIDPKLHSGTDVIFDKWGVRAVKKVREREAVKEIVSRRNQSSIVDVSVDRNYGRSP